MFDMEVKFEELEVCEEMMSDFEEGFWLGIGIVGGVTTVIGILT